MLLRAAAAFARGRREGNCLEQPGRWNPRLCPAPPEEHEEEGARREGGPDRQTDSVGERAGANPALRGGATASRRPRSTVWLRDFGCSSRTTLGSGRAGRDGAGTGYRNAGYTRDKLILKDLSYPRLVRHSLGGVPLHCGALHVVLTSDPYPANTGIVSGADPDAASSPGSLAWPFRAKVKFSHFPRAFLCL